MSDVDRFFLTPRPSDTVQCLDDIFVTMLFMTMTMLDGTKPDPAGAILALGITVNSIQEVTNLNVEALKDHGFQVRGDSRVLKRLPALMKFWASRLKR